MIEYFIVFDKSKVFVSIWDDLCDKVDKTSITTFNDIHEHVWNHTIAACKDLLHKLYNKSFNYSDIKCFADEKNVYIYVTTLYKALQQCSVSFVSSLPDLKQYTSHAVRNVKAYLEFAKYSMQANSSTVRINAVQLCLKMKEMLRLKGNFSVVNDLNIQVCMYVNFNAYTYILKPSVHLLHTPGFLILFLSEKLVCVCVSALQAIKNYSYEMKAE